MVQRSNDRFAWRLFLLAALLYVVVHSALVGRADIGGSSEAREAHIISEVVHNGEWILPRRNGIIPSKPPLFHWSGAVAAVVLGDTSERTMRAASVVYGLLTILCAALITFRLASLWSEPWRIVRPHHAALISAAVLSLTYGFHQMSCQAMVDMTYTFCVWAALTALVWCDTQQFLVNRKLSRGQFALFWFFCSLSILARGPLGPVLPLLIAGTATTLLVGPVRAALLLARPHIGWLFFALPFGWYVLAYEQGGEPFLERQLFFENLKRVTGGENINTEAWWFYGPSLLRTTLPWGFLVLIFGSLEALRGRGVSRQGLPKLGLVAPLLCLSAAMTLLSLASGKRHSYLLPLMPLVAIEAAVILAQVRERQVAARVARWVVAAVWIRRAATLLMVCLLGVGTVFIEAQWNAGPLTALIRGALQEILVPAACVTLLSLSTGYLFSRYDPNRPFFQTWAALFTLMAAVVAGGSTVKAGFKGFRAMAYELQSLSGGSDRLVVIKDSFDEYFDPILYYLAQPVRVLPAVVANFRCDEREVYFTHSRWLQESRLATTSAVVVLGTIRERKDSLLSEVKRSIVVFRCQELSTTTATALLQPVSAHP